MPEKKLHIISVGMDLTSNGGIASVVKTLYMTKAKQFDYTLLKTCHYKDKGLLFELQIFFTSLFKFLYFLSKRNFDIVHIHSSMGKSFFRKSIFLLIAKAFHKKTIFHIHSSAFDQFFIESKGVTKKYIDFILSKPDKIFVLCSDWKEKIQKTYGLDAEVIYNPISLKTEARKITKPTNLTILFLGFLIPSKGIIDLLKVAEYYKESPNVNFIIGGKGEMEFIIKNTIESKKLKNTKFIGWVDDKAKINTFKETNIAFLPSYKEGMPIVILEAMANSIPVISTNIAGIPELVKNGVNGFISTPGDTVNFIKAIDFFINCPQETYVQFCQNSRRLSNEFSDENITKKIEDIYISISKL